jgi:hypothetical protein
MHHFDKIHAMHVEIFFIVMISYCLMFWGTLEVMTYFNPCLGGGTCVGGKKIAWKTQLGSHLFCC